MIDNGTGEIGNESTSTDYPKNRIIKTDQDSEISPED